MFVHIHVTFVFAQIANVMALCEHPPDFGTKVKGVWQDLEDDMAIAGPEPMPPQGGQA